MVDSSQLGDLAPGIPDHVIRGGAVVGPVPGVEV
jgi:hypothetical protein